MLELLDSPILLSYFDRTIEFTRLVSNSLNTNSDKGISFKEDPVLRPVLKMVRKISNQLWFLCLLKMKFY